MKDIPQSKTIRTEILGKDIETKALKDESEEQILCEDVEIVGKDIEIIALALKKGDLHRVAGDGFPSGGLFVNNDRKTRSRARSQKVDGSCAGSVDVAEIIC